MTEIIIGTNIASSSRVTLLTVADHVLISAVKDTLSGVRVSRRNSVRAVASPTSNLTAQQWFTVESFDATMAIESCSKVTAINALSGLGVTRLRMAITVALLAHCEVPKSGLALIALPAVGVGLAFTLTGEQVALVVQRTNLIAVACYWKLVNFNH